MLREKQEVRRLLGYLPQEFGVYPRVSAEAMLDHFAVLKGISTDATLSASVQTVEGLLRTTNLWEVAQAEAGDVLGRHAAALRNCAGAAGRSRADHRRRADRGAGPRGATCGFLNLAQPRSGRDSVVVILSTHIVDDIRELCSTYGDHRRGPGPADR